MNNNSKIVIVKLIFCSLLIIVLGSLGAKENYAPYDGGIYLSLSKINQISVFTTYKNRRGNYLTDYSIMSAEWGYKIKDKKQYFGSDFLFKFPTFIYFISNYDKLPEDEWKNVSKVIRYSSLLFYGKHHLVVYRNKPVSESADLSKYISLYISHSKDFFLFNKNKWMNSSLGTGIRYYNSGYFLDLGYGRNFEYDFDKVKKQAFLNVLLGFSIVFAGN
jgi:hypothetical protein